jgi:hypothetical protein
VYTDFQEALEKLIAATMQLMAVVKHDSKWAVEIFMKLLKHLQNED